MGRAALLIGLSLAAAACSGGPPLLGHRALACARCHQGATSDRTLSAVPSETCSDVGCHGEISAATASEGGSAVLFEHAAHDSIESVAVGCAGCHTHREGGDPITGDVDGCGLCHQEELAASEGQGCRSCHVDLTHEGETSQGLVIPHQAFAPFAKGCLRCHYQVSEPVAEVPLDRCTACHVDRRGILEEGIGSDLHPSHVSVACGACHETDTHRIESMSSAVSLRCVDCHATEHDVALAGATAWSPTCLGCHRDTHAAEQALTLGIEPGRKEPRPAEHFSEGLTCSSCHGVERRPDPVRPWTEENACESCHRPGYGTVGQWWSEGIRARFEAVDAYVASAEEVARRRSLDGEQSAALETARARLELVRRGAGEHNVYLAHDAFVDAVDAAEGILLGAGIPSTPPNLGRRPREGFCSYCHYYLEGADERDSPFVFHDD